MGAAHRVERAQLDARGFGRHDPGQGIDGEAAGKRLQRDVAGGRRSLGVEPHAGQCLAADARRRDRQRPVEHGMAMEVAQGKIAGEPVEADAGRLNMRAARLDGHALPAAVAHQADVRLQPPGQPLQHQRREVVERAGLQREMPLGEVGHVERQAARKGHRADGDVEPVEARRAVRRAADMQRGPRRLAIDVAGEAQVCVRRGAQVGGIGRDLQMVDRLAQQGGAVHRQARRRIRVVERAGDVGEKLGAAGEPGVGLGEIGNGDHGGEVGEGGRRRAVDPRDGMRPDQRELVEGEAAVGVEPHAAGQRETVAEQSVEGRHTGRKAAGLGVDDRRETIGARRPLEGGRKAGRTLEVEARDGAEARQVRRLGGEPALEFGPARETRVAGGQRLALERQLLDVERAGEGTRAAQGDARPRPQRLREGGIGEREAPRLGVRHDLQVRRRVPQGAGRDRFEMTVEPLDAAARQMRAFERQRGAQGRRGEGAGDPRREGEPPDRRLAQRRGVRPIGPAGRRDCEVGDARRVDPPRDVELGGGGEKHEIVDGDIAVVAEDDVAAHRRGAGEHRRGEGRNEARDLRRQVEPQAARGPLAFERGGAVGADLRPGVEDEFGGEIVERAVAVEREFHRWLAGDVGERRDEPARRLVQRHVEGQLLAVGNQRHAHGQRGRPVEPLSVEMQREPLGGRAQRAVATHRETRGDAEDGLPDDHLGEGELLDLHLHRQLRQQRLVLARDGLLGRDGLAQNGQGAEVEVVDLEPPLHEGEAAPDDARPVELQPDAVAVLQHDVVDRGVGGERAVDAPDGDAAGGRRERARDQVGEDAPLLVGGSAGGREQPDPEQQREERREQAAGGKTDWRGACHQKGCPMLT